MKDEHIPYSEGYRVRAEILSSSAFMRILSIFTYDSGTRQPKNIG